MAAVSPVTDSTVESQGAGDKPIIFDTEDDQSVPSHSKTPLAAQSRENPAIRLQEYISNLELAPSDEILQKSISLSKKSSTEKCENYKDSTEKVKTLMEQLSQTVKGGMPAHASDNSLKDTKPEVHLVHGIMEAGKGNYGKAIDRFRQALMLCDAKKKVTQKEAISAKELRINSLNQIGIVLCLTGDFVEAERYFQFALEEYSEDANLINHIMVKYSELAMSAGPEFTKNSPIEQFLEATGIPSCTDETAPMESDSDSDLTGGSVTPTSMVGEGASGVDTAAGEGPSGLNKATAKTTPGQDTVLEEIESVLRRSAALRGGASEQDGSVGEGAAGGSGKDEVKMTDMSWFPSSKEELLDYSAAYIQMMIVGAEIVKSQQRNRSEESIMDPQGSPV